MRGCLGWEEPRSQEPWSGSWWLTLPGVLTGLAAVISAVTGLAVGLHQISAPSGPEKASSSEKPAADTTENESSRPSSASSSTTTSQTSSSDDAAQQQLLALPAGMEVKLRSGDLVYKILSARLEPYNSEKRALRFTVRLTTNRGYGANLLYTNFRLLVDDVPRAPINDLNEVVDGYSAKEGDVVFKVPTTETDVVLQIREGDDKTEIPFDLTATES